MAPPSHPRRRILDVGLWWRAGRNTLAQSARDRITTNAASLAFHWMLALFPALVAAVAVLGLAGLSAAHEREVVRDVGVLLPAQAAQAVDAALRNPVRGAGGGLEIAVAVAVALWSGVESMAALQVGLDVAYEITADRGFVRRRIMALPLLACTVVLGGAASILLLLGDPVRSLLPSSLAIARPTFDALWALIRWAGAVALMMVLLAAYYAIGPNHARTRLRVVSSGAVVAALGWLGASAAFSFYLDHFGHQSRSYGTFAGVAALLLWLFLTAMAVLLGAELDFELSRTRPAGSGD
ncbi:MAG: YihY/virulence factor BrkB family protein [Acidimicrobiales bacterium]|jgi:membrane protein